MHSSNIFSAHSQYPENSPKDQPATAAFFFLAIYIVIVFVRPQGFVPAILHWPLVPVTLIISFLLWSTSANKILDAPQFVLLALLFLFAPFTVAVAGVGLSLALDSLVELIPLYLTFLLIAATALSRKRMHIMMWLVTGGAVLMSVHGIQQIYTGVGWTGETTESGRIRYIDIFNDPNDVGLSLVVAIPIAAYLFHHYKSLLLKIFLLICIGIILYGIKLTDSRGTVLALAAILGVYSWRRFGMFKTLFISTLILPLLFLANSRMDTISPGEESAYGRIDAWYQGIHMLLGNPVTGVGSRMFVEHHSKTAHNSYILVLAELGIPGYFLWFSYFGTCFMMMYLLQKKARFKKIPTWQLLVEDRLAGVAKPPSKAPTPQETNKIDPQDQAIARALLLSFIGFAVAVFFLSRSYSMQLFILCGMAVAHFQGTRLRNPDIPAYRFLEHFWFWAFLSGSSVIILYLAVTILLSIV
ncbi:O-antigen ligase family protein [Thiolapillus sp.]